MLFDALTGRADFVSDGLWTLLYVLWVVGGTIFLLLRRRRPMTTMSWILAFWSVPILSGLAYFLIGPRRLDDQSELRQGARRLAAKVVPPRAGTLPRDFLDEFPLASLARVTRTEGDTEPEPRRARSVELFDDGDSAYPAILKAIAEARETLHLEYYIWQPDDIGTKLRDAVIERVKAGVKARIVVDAVGAKNCRGDFWKPVVEAGAEVRKFNPPHPFKPQPGKMNFRTHRKIIVIDGERAFTGGINISDHNCTGVNNSRKRAWRSTHLRIDGTPALDLQAIFLEDWLYGLPVDAVDSGKHEATELLEDNDEKPELPADIDRWFPNPSESDDNVASGPWVQIIDSGPDEANEDIHLLYFTAITSARERIWITTPYFVPDAPIETALESAAGRGVDVRLILPANSDSMMVEAAAKTYSTDVAKKGAKIWLYEPSMNHSKTMVIDDTVAIVGTANMDNRSFRLNFEVVAAIYDRDVTARVAEIFERDLAESRPFEPDGDHGGFVQRIVSNAARLLAPLL